MHSAVAVHGDKFHRGRLAVFGVLALSEIVLISYAFNFRTGIPEWMNPVTYAKSRWLSFCSPHGRCARE
jgi:hypothetical protein